jgi:hypothetical protein
MGSDGAARVKSRLQARMDEAEEFLRRGCECLERAAKSENPSEIVTLVRLGQAFLDTADEIQRRLAYLLDTRAVTDGPTAQNDVHQGHDAAAA